MSETMTMQERLNRYEIAQETLGFMMAIRTEAIHDEERKAVPDQLKIAEWNKEFDALDEELYALRLHDDAAVQHVLDDYCPIVKADYERRRAA